MLKINTFKYLMPAAHLCVIGFTQQQSRAAAKAKAESTVAKTFATLDEIYASNDGFRCSHCGFKAKKKAALSNHVKKHGIVVLKRVKLRPRRRRLRPTMATKLAVLNQLAAYHANHGADYPRKQFDLASGYDASCISRWLKYPRLRQVAALPWLACFKRLRTVVITGRSKFSNEANILYQRFLYRRRAMGQEVSGDWLKTEMLSIVAESHVSGWKNFRASNGWLQTFIRNYNISHQVQTEKKSMANNLRVPLLQIFHQNLCRIQQSRGFNKRDPIFGRFSPRAIWNLDQIPISFTKVRRTSYNSKNKPCWIVNHGPSGLEKRMATLVLTLRAGGSQIVGPYVLFKGKGHIDAELLAELDASGIRYGFNEKAWTNEAAAIDHLLYFNEIVKKECPEIKEHMLLLDGLSAQSTNRFVELALDLNILPVYFPPNCTHLVQPVDHRVAAYIKKCFHALYIVEEEMRYPDWQTYRENGSMCPQQLRSTVLQWTRSAWQQLLTEQTILQQAFLSTGCLITLTGQHWIKFQDIDNYSFTYPV